MVSTAGQIYIMQQQSIFQEFMQMFLCITFYGLMNVDCEITQGKKDCWTGTQSAYVIHGSRVDILKSTNTAGNLP